MRKGDTLFQYKSIYIPKAIIILIGKKIDRKNNFLTDNFFEVMFLKAIIIFKIRKI